MFGLEAAESRKGSKPHHRPPWTLRRPRNFSPATYTHLLWELTTKTVRRRLMAPSSIQLLFRKLLNLCQRWTNRPLMWLLRLISVLSRYLGIRRSNQGKMPPNGKSGATGTEVVRGCRGNGDMYSRGGVAFVRPDERAVVLASSCPPSTPPPVRTRTTVRSMDSGFSIPRSPTDTLRNSLSDDGHGGAGQDIGWSDKNWIAD